MLDRNFAGQYEQNEADEHWPCRGGVAEDEQPGFADGASEYAQSEGLDSPTYEVLDEMKLLCSAMNPVDGDDYGICVHCSAPIDSIRLTALPFVVLCVDCAEDEGRLARRIRRR